MKKSGTFTLRPGVLWVGILLGGIWWSDGTQLSPLCWVLVTITSLLLGCLLLWRQTAGWTLCLALGTFAAGGALVAAENATRLRDDRLKQDGLVGRRLYFEGAVAGVAAGSGNRVQLPFRLTRWADAPRGPWKRTRGRIRLTLQGRLSLVPGERLRVRLKLRRPRRYANPGMPNPWERLARQGIRYQGSCAKQWVVRLGVRPEGLVPWLQTVRSRWARWIDRQVRSVEAAGMLKALLLGNREDVSQETKVAFAKTGTSHLLAISGLHLALVSGLVFGAVLGLLRRWDTALLRWDLHKLAALATLPVAVGYTLVSGAAMSTRRALLMIVVVLAAVWLERRPRVETTLAFAALLLTLWQPSASFGLSFQLSFLAVIVLVLGASAVYLAAGESWLRRGAAWVVGVLWTSVVATLGTLPLTLAFFPEVPVLGPIVNLVAVPLGGTLVVGLGLLGLGFATLSPLLGGWLIQLSGMCASLLLWWVRRGAEWSRLNPTLPPFRTCEWIAYVAFFAGLLLLRRARRWGLSLLGLVPALLVFSWWWHQPSGMLEIAFLDIGQGDCAVVTFPNGHTLLVDAGGEPFAQFDTGARVVLPYLRWRRIRRLDTVVMSHPHPDHFGGFPSIFQAIPVGEFWHTGERGGHPKFRALERALRARGIRQRLFPRPWSTVIGGVQVEVLHPFPGPYEGKTYYWALDANDNSLVVRLRYGRRTILLLGDVEERAEELLVQRYGDGLKADVIKVAHHGSRTSSTELFLRAARPRHAVISLGRRNIFGFPHPEVSARLRQHKVRVWRTDRHGRILLKTDGDRLWFSTMLGE